MVGNKFEWEEGWENVEQLIMWSMCLKSLVTTRKNEIFPYLACYGQMLHFFVQKSRQSSVKGGGKDEDGITF